ncbi:MAG TPA: NUDIX domain-containing protein [Tepidiformaceae bacterium]|nr:NUDIX domain-containing protein [Tepidiformaceae bacterium]
MRIRKAIRRLAWEGERLRWRLFHPITLGARVMLIREGKVLLVEHTYIPGVWYLPGGGVDKGESLEAAARREALEEAGATVHDLVLLGMYSHFGESKSDHLAIFVSREFDWVEPPPNDEIARFAWFSLDALPEGLSPGTARRFEELAAGGPPRAGAW